MGLIRLQNVRKQFGGQVVLSDVTLELNTGQTVGLVGANGTGKTTLFRLIAGEYPPDLGTVTLSRGLNVGYLPQEPEIAENQTLHDEVMSVFADVLALEKKLQMISDEMSNQPAGPKLTELMEQYDRVNARFEAAGGYQYEQRLGEILGGLGFKPADYKLPMRALSGGQKCRAALARILLQESQFLLLDEPTNHLDIDAVRWLEKFLAGHHGGAVIISHDRYLLDRLAERIVEVDRTQVRSFPGNYTNYVRTKAVRDLTHAATLRAGPGVRRQGTRLHRQAHGQAAYGGSEGPAQTPGAAPGGGRVHARRTHAEPQGQVPLRRDCESNVTAGKNVLDVRGLCKRYDESSLFARPVVADSRRASRFGITGPNGTGKTTCSRSCSAKWRRTPVCTSSTPRPALGTTRRSDRARPGKSRSCRKSSPSDRTCSRVRHARTRRDSCSRAKTRSSWSASFPAVSNPASG